ncbi:MAG: hypothetical protein ACEQSX_12875 [Baekduiaceae bacterium]
MSHKDDHERNGEVCRSCARVGRAEALQEARDIVAAEERDARNCLRGAGFPDRYAMGQRLEGARKSRQAIERLPQAPAPLPDDEPPPGPVAVTSEENVVPISRARRGAKRRK